MSLTSHLSNLFESGRVVVPPFGPLVSDEVQEAALAIEQLEKSYRLELPGEPPVFDLSAGIWAARLCFRLCQFVVFRDIPPAVISEEMQIRCPRTGTASVHYSVDVTLRFLPDVARLARSAAENDPLVELLRKLGGEWPLSSVGMEGVMPGELKPILDNRCLFGVYVDRIIARRDVGRLVNLEARDGVRRALGLHPELAPELSAALKQYEETSR